MSMRMPIVLALALAASLLVAAPSALGAESEHEVFLHEYTGGLHIVPEQIRADVGDVLKFSIMNQGAAPHNLVMCGDEVSPSNDCQDVWGRVGMIQPNATLPMQFTAEKAGTFEYWCYVPGHKGGGMKGTLIVEGAAEEKGIPDAGVVAALLAIALVAGVRRP